MPPVVEKVMPPVIPLDEGADKGSQVTIERHPSEDTLLPARHDLDGFREQEVAIGRISNPNGEHVAVQYVDSVPTTSMPMPRPLRDSVDEQKKMEVLPTVTTGIISTQ
ncbi:hypothetical protein [Legionella tunisiensis]|uniref:hypothetical protein n=1 Tax=Legionella tunisiensis TaxID=1034944 RepID=UPI00031B6D84|nr:hypothetical protein [Legionella tunisiensis]